MLGCDASGHPTSTSSCEINSSMMAILQVPPWVKAAFDTFPLATYGAVPTGDESDIEKDRFYFTTKRPETSLSTFILGVDNVISVKHRQIPTTPVALSHALLLCHKNALGLPNSKGQRSGHSMLRLSYLAAADNELPIIIETNEAGTSRNVIPKKGLLKSILTNNNFESDPKAKLINNMVDMLVQDLWLLALMCDVKNTEVLGRIYRLPTSIKDTRLVSLQSMAIRNVIPHWNDFRTRHPHLFSAKEYFVADKSSHALQAAYNAKLSELRRELPLLLDYVSAPGALTNVIKFKVAALAILTTELLPETKLAELFQQHQSFVQQAYELLEEF